ncbi:MAG TPA: DUF2341 domain-containing protein, partial [Candidatus Thermoplasmatota archaeon]|nr:DUF2341 domain-containing protein [Candidatus Thermoplasmatota archaeon]
MYDVHETLKRATIFFLIGTLLASSYNGTANIVRDAIPVNDNPTLPTLSRNEIIQTQSNENPQQLNLSIQQNTISVNNHTSIALPSSYTGWYNKPTSYAQMISWYQELEIAYPNYLQVFKANELYGLGTIPNQNYDMYYVRLTNESLGFQKPEVLFMTNIHGNEYIGPTSAFWFTDWLLRHAFHPNYTCPERDWLRWLLDNREIYIIPSQNPDGFDDVRRENFYGLDLNRDFDHSRPNPWAAVNSQILRRFIDNHTIRIAVDMHTGYRGIPYSWSNMNYRTTLGAISPISGRNYPGYCPPDFYFLDAALLRVGNYVGDYGGNLYSSNIGPWPYTLGYDADGTSCDWWNGGDVITNPAEDPYVNDEIYGNYPGCGIMGHVIEYGPHNPANSEYGNDTINRYGAEVRRTMLHQIDLAQPYLRWLNGTTTNNTIAELETPLTFNWQVNGSLVVDNTFIQWGRNPDPLNNPEYNTTDYDDHAGDYYGGTGWDGANNGQTNGVTYSENIMITTPGDYYFVAKAKVDQRYKTVLHPEEYGNSSYLRLIKERTNDSFYESRLGTDGLEVIDGQTWWYSPVIHVHVSDWWNTSWQYRKKISIDHTKVAANLTNYPLLINLASNIDLIGKIQNDAGDIVFTDKNRNKLNHEIELYNYSTGQLIVWVNVTRLSHITNTTLYMYYGNQGCQNQENPSGVWSSSYQGVWHLNSNFLDSTIYNNDVTNYGSTPTAGWIGDSQYFAGDDYITAPTHCLGTNHSWTASCWFRSNSSSPMLFHYFFSTGHYDANNAVTIWQNINSPGNIGELRAQIVDSDGHRANMFNYGGTNFKDNVWHLLHVTWNASSHDLAVYGDGVLQRQQINTTVDTGGGTTNPLYIGTRIDLEAQRFHVGELDELRISNPVKNTSWIATEYNNQRTPDSFYIVGSEETIITQHPPILLNPLPLDNAIDTQINPLLSIQVIDPEGDTMNVTFRTNASGIWVTIGSNLSVINGVYSHHPTQMNNYHTTYYWSVNITDPYGSKLWTNITYRFTTSFEPGGWWNTQWFFRKSIVIDHTQISSTLLNFPMLMSISSDPTLAMHAKTNGSDIVFTDYYGHQLNHEIESYESTTGNLEAWVKIPILSSSQDTSLYMYYGNPLCNNQETPLGVWETNYQGVWHLNDDVLDSTSHDNDATNHGSINTSGQIGKGRFFDGNDYLSAPKHYLGAEWSWTASCWFYSNASSMIYHYLLSTGQYDSPSAVSLYHNINHIEYPPIGEMRARINDMDNHFIQLYQYNGVFPKGTWNLVHLTWDANSHTFSVFINGSLENRSTNTAVDIGGGAQTGLFMGARQDFDPQRYLVGKLDEVRIATSLKNASWIAAEYVNQYNPNEFYNLGVEEVGLTPTEPTFWDEHPATDASDIGLQPILSIRTIDYQGDTFDLYFKTNASGTWQTIGGNLSIGNGTYSCTNTLTINNYLTKYWWSVNATDASSDNWTNLTFRFTTRPKNYVPLIVNVNPAHGDTNVPLNPTLSIQISDRDGDIMNITFKTNTTGIWKTIGSYNNTGNGTYTQTTTNMSTLGKTYYWRINISDSKGNWTNATHWFKTVTTMLSLKWMIDLGGGAKGSPCVANVTGDSTPEVIAVTSSGVKCIDSQTGSVIWSRSYSGIGEWVQPEVADLNNDEVPEVLVPIQNPPVGLLVLYGNNGSTYWVRRDLGGEWSFGVPITYDIDGDGYPTVFFASTDVSHGMNGTGRVTALSYDGQILHQAFSWRPCAGGLSLADYNFDGIFELYMNDRSEYPGGKGLRSFWASNLTCRWNQTGTGTISSHVTILVDVNNDGLLECVVAPQSTTGGVMVLSAVDGHIMKGSTEMNIPAHEKFTVYDIDHDGRLESIHAENEHPGMPKDIVVWDLVNWQRDATITIPTTCYWPPIAAEVTGDSILDIVAGGNGRLMVFNQNYSSVASYTGLQQLQQPVVNDIDGDGYNEIVVLSDSGRLYSFDTPGITPTPTPRSVKHYSEYRRNAAEYVEPPGPRYPMQRDESPTNKSTLVTFNPVLSVHVWDYQWDRFNITFRTNASGTWQDIKTYASIGRYPSHTITGNSWGRYTANTTNMTQPNKTYYWSIYAKDIKGNTHEKIYHFTVGDVAPIITNPLPVDGVNGVSLSLSTLQFTLTDCQGNRMNYSVYTTPNIGTGSRTLVTNGTYTISLNGLEYNTFYTWFVHITDGTHWTNKTYHFTTRLSPSIWWNNNWTFRKEIIIDNTQVAGPLTNFPVLINLNSDYDLATHVQDDGDDLVFTDHARNILYHEIELFNGTTGQLVAWVNVTSLSSTSPTLLYLYYGNPAVSSQQNPTGVWKSNYLTVHHLEETSGALSDSTSYHHNGTPYGGLQQNITGIIDGADRFDGVNDYIDLGATPDFNKQDLTISAWVKSSVPTTDMRIVVGGASYTYKWHLIMDDGYFMMTNNTLATTN